MEHRITLSLESGLMLAEAVNRVGARLRGAFPDLQEVRMRPEEPYFVARLKRIHRENGSLDLEYSGEWVRPGKLTRIMVSQS